MPERIQLRRTKGWRKPEGAISVARPTKWGNPYIVGDDVEVPHPECSFTTTITPTMAVEGYRQLMEIRLLTWDGMHPEDRAYSQEWEDGLAELRGHDLACYCPLDQPCHADVLLELANR